MSSRVNIPALHRETSHEAIELSFFNLFWIFIICSVVGLFGETIVSFFRDGRWESRAGLIFGPLSPIYGLGAVLITIALNRLANREPLVVFAVSGAVGASFEYFAGWFLESAFGIVAWSYEGQFVNFHGHTSLFMACVWGVCGLLWMRFALPFVMKVIDRIPLQMRSTLTTVCALLLFADVLLTLSCLECWFLRMQGAPLETPWQVFCAQYFDNNFMQTHFETMSMWTVLASR